MSNLAYNKKNLQHRIGGGGEAEFNGKVYKTQVVLDVIHSEGAEILGTYTSDFFSGEPAVTRNKYGKGTAYYTAFRNDEDFTDDFCDVLIKELGIRPDTDIIAPRDILIRKRGGLIFIFNFTGEEKTVSLDKAYLDILGEKEVSGELLIPPTAYFVLK